jgi:hypothetical protein
VPENRCGWALKPSLLVTLGKVDMVDVHLEVNVIPVSDIERSKKFYDQLGWRFDEDVAPSGHHG